MNLGKFDRKTVEKSRINTIFKQQVISEPQKLLHFQGPEHWLLVKKSVEEAMPTNDLDTT